MPEAGRAGARRPVEIGLVALAALVVAAVSTIGLGVPSLWWDEIATLSASTRPFPDLLALVGHVDLVHLAYYATMHGWLAVVPHDAFWLRLPSALALGATVPVVYAIGRMLSGRAVAVVGVIVFLALPRTAWTATEGRSFALTTLVASLVVVLVLVAARTGRPAALVGLALTGVAVILLWIYAAAVLAAAIAAVPWLTRSGRRRLAVIVAAGSPLVVTAPFIVAVIGQRGQVGGTRPVGLGLVKSVVAEQWFPGATPIAVAFWLVFAVLLAVAVVRRRSTGGAATLERGGVVLLVVWLVLPLVVVVGASALLDRSVYQPRAFAFTSPALALLFAAAAVRALGERLATALAVVLAIATIPAFTGLRLPGAKGVEWAGAAALVAAAADGQSAVVFVDNRTTPGMVVEVPSAMPLGYPDAFARLDDVAVVASPVDADELFAVREGLGSWPDLLAAYDRVVVVRGTLDGAVETVEADAALTGVGFREESAASVPGTWVEVWTR